MDDHVRLAPQSWLERSLEHREEVGAASAAIDACPRRQIEAEVGVGDEQDPQPRAARVLHHSQRNVLRSRGCERRT